MVKQGDELEGGGKVVAVFESKPFDTSEISDEELAGIGKVLIQHFGKRKEFVDAQAIRGFLSEFLPIMVSALATVASPNPASALIVGALSKALETTLKK